MGHPTDRTQADAYLDLLHRRGVEYLFGNAGTDFGPLIDAYAGRLAAGEPSPEPLAVTHEVTAVAMAHGYAMVSGKTPAVMVHTVAGTANSIGGLINANRSQVPMLFTAGRTPLTEGDTLGARDMHIHWAQESYDQGAMVREWVKWDYELRVGADLAGVVDRAVAIAETEPKGPVYLTLPREVLAARSNDGLVSAEPAIRPAATMASPADVERAVTALVQATNPIIITRSAGRDAGAAHALTALAERLGAPVFDPYPTHVNLDFDHHLHVLTGPDQVLPDADVVVVVESDVPWIPRRSKPATGATVIAVATDPLHAAYPIRGFPVDIGLAGSLTDNLRALTAGYDQLGDRVVDEERLRRWSAVADEVRRSATNRAEQTAATVPLQKPWFSHTLNELLPDDAIVVDELGNDVQQLTIGGPGRFFGVSQAGVLGWGLGAALGAKLAAPEQTVAAVIGDGSYLFGAPTTAHWAARRYDLPVLYLVWNNAKWNAVERSTRMVYPEGHAAVGDRFVFSDLQPSIDYELVCQAAGGFGERVDDPAALPAAIERGLKAVTDGRQALLNLIAHD